MSLFNSNNLIVDVTRMNGRERKSYPSLIPHTRFYFRTRDKSPRSSPRPIYRNDIFWLAAASIWHRARQLFLFSRGTFPTPSTSVSGFGYDDQHMAPATIFTSLRSISTLASSPVHLNRRLPTNVLKNATVTEDVLVVV